MTVFFDKLIVDSIDILAIHHGDDRKTRIHKENEKIAGAPIRFTPPTDAQVGEAKWNVPRYLQVLCAATRADTGSFPAPRMGETDGAYLGRLEHQYLTNGDFWKRAILKNAAFLVPAWVTSALAQDGNWQPGRGDLDDHEVPNERRVHIEGVCIVKNKDTNEDEERHFVLYPQAIERLTGPIKLTGGATGKIHRELVELSGWRICGGWATRSRKPPGNVGGTEDKASGEGSESPRPKPKW
jgi:hypothetical protein